MYTEFAIVPAGSSTVISVAVIALVLLGVAGLALSPAYGAVGLLHWYLTGRSAEFGANPGIYRSHLDRSMDQIRT